MWRLKSIYFMDQAAGEMVEMKENTIFPREEGADVLFQKILEDPWACERLQETFCNFLVSDEDIEESITAEDFAKALFDAYRNRDLSAFLMAISQNTMFDLLRNSFLIPYRFNADGNQNPVLMTDENGKLISGFEKKIREIDYRHFREAFEQSGGQSRMYMARAYRYSHQYSEDGMQVMQKVLETHTGVLLVYELPDTVRQKKTQAQAYVAVWDRMIEIEKKLPMSFVFYGQELLTEDHAMYDEMGIFLPDSLFLKDLEKHIRKAEAIIHGQN